MLGGGLPVAGLSRRSARFPCTKSVVAVDIPIEFHQLVYTSTWGFELALEHSDMYLRASIKLMYWENYGSHNPIDRDGLELDCPGRPFGLKVVPYSTGVPRGPATSALLQQGTTMAHPHTDTMVPITLTLT